MEKGGEVREVWDGGEMEGWMKVQNEVREVWNGGEVEGWRRVVKCVKRGMVEKWKGGEGW